MSDWYTEEAYPGTKITASENGWMTSEIFLSWFNNFCKNVTQRPLMLIYDGQSTHINYKLIKKAREEQVTILKLPSHTADCLQPLNVCCFRPLKTQWDNAIAKWTKDHNVQHISKMEFNKLVGKK